MPDLEADLVVALAGAAVGHERGAVAAGLGHQVLDDDRARQCRHQRVLALVLGVGQQCGHTEVLGHLDPGVDDGGLDGAGGQRPVADGVPVLAARLGGLADIDGHGDHLDALVLHQPPHGHGGVETPAVGQHHTLGHRAPLVSCPIGLGLVGPRSDPVARSRSPLARRPSVSGGLLQSRQHGQPAGHGRPADGLGGHHQNGVVTGDGADDPGEAAPVERRAYDMGGARRGAEHDQVAGVVGLDHPLPQHPAQMVLGGDLVGGQLGQGVGGVAPGQAHLDRAQLLQVPGHRGLGGVDPSAASSSTRWAWLPTALDSSSLVIRCWRWCLVILVIPAPRRPAGQPGQQAPHGVHPVGRLLPHHASGPVDHPGADLLAPVGGQAVQHHGVGCGPGDKGLVDAESGERGEPGRGARPPGPSTVHTSV